MSRAQIVLFATAVAVILIGIAIFTFYITMIVLTIKETVNNQSGVTKKIWLQINPGFYSIEDFRKQSTFGVDKVIEVEVTCGIETKEFTYEKFFGLLGFAKKSIVKQQDTDDYAFGIHNDANDVTVYYDTDIHKLIVHNGGWEGCDE